MDLPEMSEEILELLDCPVCFATMYPPLFQCRNGHAICATCWIKALCSANKNCSICREQLGHIRCLLLEKILSTMTLRCRYQSKGCTELVLYDSMAKHEETCRFKPYNCPFPCRPPCDVKEDDIPSPLAHMRDVHHCSSTSLKSTDGIDSISTLLPETTNKILENADQLSIFEYMGDHFCLRLEKLSHDNLYVVHLTFMGEDRDARKYRCTLEVGNDDATTTRMTWRGIPKSIRETNHQIGDSGELMVLHEKVLRKLAETDDGIWELILRVEKDVT